MQMVKRRQFSSEYKVKVVLEVLREERTLGEIASAHQINPNQLATWRREFLERASGLFDEPRASKAQQRADREAAAEKERLLKTIGQLTMERDFLQEVKARIDNPGRFL